MKKLFGTDGIRSKAGEFPLDPETLRMIGFALASRLRELGTENPRLITGRDTRESGPQIEREIHAGIKAAGAEAISAGVMTTPGVAYLTRARGFDAGVVVSASHNPYKDNGIKVFMPEGRKLDGESEAYIEEMIGSGEGVPRMAEGLDDSGAGSLRSRYLQHFSGDFPLLDLTGVAIIADCANGAASELAPLLFRKFGAAVKTINAEPDGRNINRECGSLHLEGLRLEVMEAGASIGIAFDGDADRALFIDEEGDTVDGDAVLWIMAKALKDRGQLKDDKVVATVMSNVGLELALRSREIELIRTDVGDKFVLDELVRSGASIGGEQSGHIIFPFRSMAGDGMQTALFVLEEMSESGKKLSELKAGFVSYPQILVNVRVREKVPFDEIAPVSRLAEEIADQINGTGRLLLRYSGTENLARVMMEGEDQDEIEVLARKLAGEIESAIGEEDR